ncbi:MAG TPA: uroporphyrinogen-III C-methyltransferase [Solirubrobacteraceae bacterium]
MSDPEASAGRVYLVGAGPGDPGLLTARALELIAAADVVLYDRLIPAEALAGARAEAELLFVGKEGGGDSVPQEQTEALLVDRARAGLRVVRLKGGDPFVFGRGGEEALALRAAGISFEVVPGVTAGIAASAYAGIPVTHRGLSTAVALVTGHTREDQPGAEGNVDEQDTIDWPALAAFPGTLVFYMGVRQLPHIAASLIGAGRASDEPAAVVERGTLSAQRTVTGTLATIAERAQDEQIRPPSITVIGQVAQLAADLAWLPARPLSGRTVAVTRARAQASGLALRLGELGARVVQAPTIRTRTIAGPPLDPSPYELICLTSPNGVRLFFERLAAGGLDARALAAARVAVIGPGTARALAEHGITADIVPERFLAESLVAALAQTSVRRALIATARGARAVLADALRARGTEVEVLELYETVAEPLSKRALDTAREADYLTFTSASTVRYFVQAAGGSVEVAPATRIVSIGPVTSEALREHGLQVDVEAARHDIDGVVQALLDDTADGAP